VAVAEGVGEGGGDPEGVVDREGPLAVEAGLEGLAPDVLGDEVGGALVLAGVVEPDDVGVIDPAEAAASRAKRLRSLGLAPRPGRRSFRATTRPVTGARARETTPAPPRAISPSRT